MKFIIIKKINLKPPKDELQNLRNKSNHLQNIINNLQNELQSSENTINNLQNELQSSENTINNLQNELQSSENISNLVCQLQSKNNEIDNAIQINKSFPSTKFSLEELQYLRKLTNSKNKRDYEEGSDAAKRQKI
jgi:hypothetical protein